MSEYAHRDSGFTLRVPRNDDFMLVVIPAKAGIQYPRGVAVERRSRGVRDRPVKPGDDSGVCGASERFILTLPAVA
jgi:hypothetical protein